MDHSSLHAQKEVSLGNKSLQWFHEGPAMNASTVPTEHPTMHRCTTRTEHCGVLLRKLHSCTCKKIHPVCAWIVWMK